MHDLDRTLQEFEMGGVDALESDAFELEFWDQGEYSDLEVDVEVVFDEVEEMELAAELLEITTEEELDQFLGKLIKQAGKAVGKLIRSPVGKALGGVIKNVAKNVLPMAGAALGNMILPGVGGAAGSFVADTAGKMFGLELEGMSPQDQEFEVARRVVRLAGEATRQAAQTQQDGNPVRAAKDAVLVAAEIHAPGLVSAAVDTVRDASRHFTKAANTTARGVQKAVNTAAQSVGRAVDASVRDAQRNFAQAGVTAPHGTAAAGRWIRRGDTIVLLGV